MESKKEVEEVVIRFKDGTERPIKKGIVFDFFQDKDIEKMAIGAICKDSIETQVMFAKILRYIADNIDPLLLDMMEKELDELERKTKESNHDNKNYKRKN